MLFRSEFISLGDIDPGGCTSKVQNLIGIVWINPNGCKLKRIHPLEVLCHEMLHILMDAFYITGDDNDQFVYRMELIVLEKFCSINNIKLEKGNL